MLEDNLKSKAIKIQIHLHEPKNGPVRISDPHCITLLYIMTNHLKNFLLQKPSQEKWNDEILWSTKKSDESCANEYFSQIPAIHVKLYAKQQIM